MPIVGRRPVGHIQRPDVEGHTEGGRGVAEPVRPGDVADGGDDIPAAAGEGDRRLESDAGGGAGHEGDRSAG
jgi:hypothetical protein